MEPKDPIDAYDQQHGRPEATPDAKPVSEDDAWGGKLNPVRETPNAAANLRDGGSK